MSKIIEIIEFLKEHWGTPRAAVHHGKQCPFLLACSFATEPASDTLTLINYNLPQDVWDFWRVAKMATLFEDQEFGQWGIEVLRPEQAIIETARRIEQRPKDFVSSDLVIGKFFGDSDLVVISCDPTSPNFGCVTIALPIDPRCDWPVAADSFTDFLTRLVEEQGDKYWESNKSP